ncbi:MAG: outer membrane protein assembly factor BamE [Methylomonas sp.]
MHKSVFWLSAAALTLTACTSILNNMPGIYRLDIDQGNVINQSMVDQLRPEMSRRQVLFIMGSPMLIDDFHDQRWDYIYAKLPGGGDREQQRLSLYFEGDTLVGVQGDLHPSAEPTPKVSSETSVDLPKRELEKSMWQKVAGLFGIDPGVDPDDGVTPTQSGGQGSGAGSSGGGRRR